jgi:hypothetical protein
MSASDYTLHYCGENCEYCAAAERLFTRLEAEAKQAHELATTLAEEESA